eukprot:Gb_12817 [translate_table: standard]
MTKRINSNVPSRTPEGIAPRLNAPLLDAVLACGFCSLWPFFVLVSFPNLFTIFHDPASGGWIIPSPYLIASWVLFDSFSNSLGFPS